MGRNENMKKIFLGILMLGCGISYGEDAPFSSAVTGVHVVPIAQLDLPSDLKKELTTNQSEESLKGYQETDGQNAQYLLNIKKDAAQQLNKINEKDDGVYGAHLKTAAGAIKLAFPFDHIKGVSSQEIIGYAPIGSFEANGWNGIRVIFSKQDFGNCSYSRMKIVGVELAKETTEYFVNQKPSNKMVEGSQNAGFLYIINWYTNHHMNTLECANKAFNPDMFSKMIGLANQIDRG
jgi:hypothetical protein